MLVRIHSATGHATYVETPDSPTPEALATPEAQQALVSAIVAVFTQPAVAWDTDDGICSYTHVADDGSVCRCVVGHFAQQWRPSAWNLVEGEGVTDQAGGDIPDALTPNDRALLVHLQRAHDEAADEAAADKEVPDTAMFRRRFAHYLAARSTTGFELAGLRTPILAALERVRLQHPECLA